MLTIIINFFLVLLKQIVRKQVVLHGMVSQLMDDISGLKDKQTPPADENMVSLFCIFDLPFNDEDTLHTLEEYLKDKGNFDVSVIILQYFRDLIY